MTFDRFPPREKPEPETTFPRPQTPPPPLEEKKPDESTVHKVERKPKVKKPKAEAKPEEKEEKAAPTRKARTTVLRDLVEDLESDKDISDDMRYTLQELNRRLTRALAS